MKEGCRVRYGDEVWDLDVGELGVGCRLDTQRFFFRFAEEGIDFLLCGTRGKCRRMKKKIAWMEI